jgi:UDP-N-acetylglucosamine 1-carboxyvinyltransferase
MDRIRVRGGRRLKGEIPISGAKNAALPLMAACLLTEEPLRFINMPSLADVMYMADILRQLGVAVSWHMAGADGEGGSLDLTAPKRPQSLATYEAVRKMRASFLVLGPMLARIREATVSLPGGCAIGARPVDLHLKGLAAMGAEIELAGGYVLARAPSGLKGAEFEFPMVSVGATENLLMAASLASGRTVLSNAARAST